MVLSLEILIIQHVLKDPQSQFDYKYYVSERLEVLILQHSVKGLRARSVRIIVWP